MPDGSVNIDPRVRRFHIAKATDAIAAMLPKDDPFRGFYLGLCMETKPPELEAFLKGREAYMAKANAIADAFRANTRARQFPKLTELIKGNRNPALAKSTLDVGTITNMTQVVGGQALGYFSLDTQMARGTVRPSSFTLYQALRKSHAFQVVDYWAYASEIGGSLPGTSFSSFGSVSSGTLATDAGDYDLQNIFLKLAVNGRALTTALAAQNSFVDVAAQENANAALTVLSSLNWASYWGDSSVYPNQFDGIWKQLPAANIVDYQNWYNTYASNQGWSSAQALFNLIYEWSAQITSYNQFGRVTHAFMSPQVAASIQGLVTGVLNNIVTAITAHADTMTPIVVNGDLQGMRTRFGDIQFPIDIFITVRDKPAQAIKKNDGTNFATTTNPTPPASVTVAAATGAAGSAWTGSYVATGQFTEYAVASTDADMNESTLTYATAISGIAAGGEYNLTINGPGAADAVNFRVYRSGLGYSASSGQNPAAFRYIGTIAASGSGAVTFHDLNTKIPGGETIFLLDLDEEDMAVDFRYLLPLTKIELFAQNLYMPWAVCAIGAVRLKIPKFNGAIQNYVADNADWNPLSPNTNSV